MNYYYNKNEYEYDADLFCSYIDNLKENEINIIFNMEFYENEESKKHFSKLLGKEYIKIKNKREYIKKNLCFIDHIYRAVVVTNESVFKLYFRNPNYFKNLNVNIKEIKDESIMSEYLIFKNKENELYAEYQKYIDEDPNRDWGVIYIEESDKYIKDSSLASLDKRINDLKISYCKTSKMFDRIYGKEAMDFENINKS